MYLFIFILVNRKVFIGAENLLVAIELFKESNSLSEVKNIILEDSLVLSVLARSDNY